VTRKSGWEEPSTGPDWMDVESLMRAIGALHSAHVAVIVSPSGTGFGTGVDVVASALFERLPGSQLPASVTATGRFPCNTHTKLVALAFSLLHSLDFEIGKVYEQASLWK
jgi:hypothetical protein